MALKPLIDSSQTLLKRGLLPDAVIRFGIRQLLKQKLKDENRDSLELGRERFMNFVNRLRSSPIAINTEEANRQHYELPAEFFQLVMGRHMKYSSGYWREQVRHLDQAEEDMLEITAERANLRNGHSILELGCGWGSLSLFMAKKFPQSRVVAVSNARSQKEFIDRQCTQRGIKNLEVITADMNTFTIADRFDRVVSVEMFEHMRNYEKLLAKISGFLKPDGQLFVHIFTHREHAYLYDTDDVNDWIAKYFFTGGMMPSDDLLLYFQDDFRINYHWRVSGTHYEKTSNAWLNNMDRHKDRIMPILEKTYGREHGTWWNYWRVFFMSCAELWGYRKGTEWIVSHYLFDKKP